jgi:hypothetical protein
MKKLEGYLDTSGKQETIGDQALIVAVSLSTPLYWREFDKEWTKILVDEKVPIKPNKTRPVFHTTEFMNKNYPFRDKFGWDSARCDNFYNKLINIINRRSLYSFAMCVDLEDYRRFIGDYPEAQQLFGSAGNFASTACFYKCVHYANKWHYDETISYVFDRGDTFRKELESAYDAVCRNAEDRKEWYFKVGGLTFGDKEKYTPIQAVDVIAWECGKHIKDAQKTTIETGQFTRHAIVSLSHSDAEFLYYSYESFLTLWMNPPDYYKNNEKES